MNLEPPKNASPFWQIHHQDVIRLAAEGLSARCIATKIGAASRQAVIGYCHRNDIQLHGQTPQPFIEAAARARAEREEAERRVAMEREIVSVKPSGICRAGTCRKTRLTPYEFCQEHMPRRKVGS